MMRIGFGQERNGHEQERVKTVAETASSGGSGGD